MNFHSFSRAIVLSSFALAAGLFTGCTHVQPETQRHTFAIGTNDFLLDGQRFQIRCGEIHSARVPEKYWRNRLRMAKAMGLNTVCAYLFWNLHEPRPGEFNWTGQADVATFCRIAQQEGLWVILRPGPYSCAEWEMGGTPWWLLKYDDIQLRTRDPHYLDAAKNYLNEVGRVLGPLQITHGGNIIMVQVENEYGFFGKDTAYVDALRQAIVDAGFDVPLFQCNPPDLMKNGLLPGMFQAGNFGSDVVKNFEKVRKLQPSGPLICSEFYPGWFDTWGQPHHLGKPENYLPNLKTMLDMDASFSIYMVHGGTTFGLWSGCDRPFKPDTSSYDYDAPISEAGWPTPKFFATRELFSKYLLPGETLPDVPATNPVVSFAPIELNEVAPIFDHLPAPIHDETPRSMEAYDQGYGCILYRTKIPAGDAITLEAGAIHDFGFVFVDGRRVGILDRRDARPQILLPAREQESQLDILVEPMGRINFGTEMADHKGLIAPVKLGGEILKDWEIFNLPLDAKMLAGLNFTNTTIDLNTPAFWRGEFVLENAGDTFLDLRNLGKGDVWVNGHCLGRFWNIGPTQTAYAPGCWLHAGTNEIVVLDILGSENHTVAGLERPILDELHPEKDFLKNHRPLVKLNLDSATPVHSGAFAPGGDTQDIKFSSPATGKYFCLESMDAFDGQPFAAIAELDLLDADGNAISHNGWTIAYVDSEERNIEDGVAENAIDGQTANYWHTEWKNARPDYPHYLVLNLGKSQTISGFRYVPRQGSENGRIKDYRILIDNDLVH
ncbi:MAG TPA: beta-galactosidase [Candidatus Sulfotelmatobacter sp.]|jgi:beta-galactosidase|nr:beta-galactosidase [Candidatus Sulfotelmatobacter sp.]